jgi:hypothetical protein
MKQDFSHWHCDQTLGTQYCMKIAVLQLQSFKERHETPLNHHLQPAGLSTTIHYNLSVTGSHARESIVRCSSVLFLSESSTGAFHVVLFRYAGYMNALRTKDEPLLPLGMKDSLGQSFDFQNQRQST